MIEDEYECTRHDAIDELADRAYDEWRDNLTSEQYENHKRLLDHLGKGGKMYNIYFVYLDEGDTAYYFEVGDNELIGFGHLESEEEARAMIPDLAADIEEGVPYIRTDKAELFELYDYYQV